MRLLETIRGLCTYATAIRGLSAITGLREVLSEEIVCGFIDWLRVERGRGTSEILTSMAYLKALLRE